MRDKKNEQKYKRKPLAKWFFALALSFICLFSFTNIANAAEKSQILLVGLYPTELSQTENHLLAGKEVIQLPYDANWMQTIRRYPNASNVVLKQPSGFVGLYDGLGDLERQVMTSNNPDPNYLSNVPAPGSRVSAPVERWDKQLGYTTGGRRDPYRYQNPVSDNTHSVLAPGWGYNSGFASRSRGSGSIRRTLSNFLSFVPIDYVSPITYPGGYNSLGIGAAYGLGVIPHIGGLINEVGRARSNSRQYQQATNATIPFYSEYPVQYYRNQVNDPVGSGQRFLSEDYLGEAFRKNLPETSAEADYYRSGINTAPRPNY